MSYEFFIAKRYLKSSRGTSRKVVSWISIGGVFVGVACLIIVMSVENGFHKTLIDKILGANPDIVVSKFYNEPIDDYEDAINKIKNLPYVISVKPSIYSKGMIKSDYSCEGIAIRGVSGLSEIKNVKGKLANGIVLGKDLADLLRTYIGDTVTLLGLGYREIVSPLNIRTKKFEVTGIFDAGLYEYNSTFAYLPLNLLQSFLKLKKAVTGIEVKLDDIYKAPLITDIINQRLGYPYRATNWMDLNSSLFAALKLEKITMFTLLTLIIIVACFGIAGNLITTVVRKTREIGILKSLGATPRSIMKIFMLQGVMIGVIGTLSGAFAGWLISFLLGKYHFIHLPALEEVWNTSSLPVNMRVSDFLIVCIGAIFISFIASAWPAYRASKLLPYEAIRYE